MGKDLEAKVIEKIKTVFDPEIPINIYELGLIYKVELSSETEVEILMTLTAPGCPEAGVLPGKVEEAVRLIPEIKDVKIELTFDPPWGREMMSDAAKLELGFF